jgi:hypothetical protein
MGGAKRALDKVRDCLSQSRKPWLLGRRNSVGCLSFFPRSSVEGNPHLAGGLLPTDSTKSHFVEEQQKCRHSVTLQRPTTSQFHPMSFIIIDF